jgi:asparagine synthase (glutamine-hydrolysing)
MCSIAGFSSASGLDIKKMISIQSHRAPDEEAFFEDEFFSIGMGRLSIVDINKKDLALYRYKDAILAFNGEIYNFKELKVELKDYVEFTTNSDIEVLLKAWFFWGNDIFDKLDGMFAIAIYDIKNLKITLARDFVGEKPLYYYFDGKDFLFSSEAKAIHSIKGLTLQSNKFYHAFQHCLHDTLFLNLKQLKPGNFAVYDIRSCNLDVYEYWFFHPRKIYVKTAVDELEDLIVKSMRLRTNVEVDLGIYLSDGLDSNLLNTFYDFKTNEYFFDDSFDWKNEFYYELENIVYHLDFPVGSLSSFPLWKLAQRASNDVKVIISGEGADELFGGYVRYLPIGRQWELEKKFPSYKPLFQKYYNSYLENFSRLTSRDEDLQDFVYNECKQYFDLFEDPINAMGYADFKLVMPSLLQMGDRMAGAFGIENRCPFLDKKIVEFAFSLPSHLKIKNLHQKVLLRQVSKRRGQSAGLSNEKKGLTITFNKWFNRNDWNRNHYFQLLNKKWLELYS